MTYTALASLIVLGDDLSRINRENIAQAPDFRISQ
jgi:hypothetical protein